MGGKGLTPILLAEALKGIGQRHLEGHGIGKGARGGYFLGPKVGATAFEEGILGFSCVQFIEVVEDHLD
jgi:hypothetical protein